VPLKFAIAWQAAAYGTDGLFDRATFFKTVEQHKYERWQT
jgi:hypothetical protein